MAETSIQTKNEVVGGELERNVVFAVAVLSYFIVCMSLVGFYESDPLVKIDVFHETNTFAWMKSNWWFVFVLVTFYWMCMIAGRYSMHSKEPFQLNFIFGIWKSLIATLLILCTCQLMPLVWEHFHYHNFRLQDMLCEKGGWIFSENYDSYVFILFLVMNFAQFGDVVFLVLAKKPINFFYWLHHSGVFCIMYFASAWELSWILLGLINSVSQAITCIYYAMDTFGYKPNNYSSLMSMMHVVEDFLTFSLLLTVLLFASLSGECYSGLNGPFYITLISFIFIGFFLIIFLRYCIISFERFSPKKYAVLGNHITTIFWIICFSMKQIKSNESQNILDFFQIATTVFLGFHLGQKLISLLMEDWLYHYFNLTNVVFWTFGWVGLIWCDVQTFGTTTFWYGFFGLYTYHNTTIYYNWDHFTEKHNGYIKFYPLHHNLSLILTGSFFLFWKPWPQFLIVCVIWWFCIDLTYAVKYFYIWFFKTRLSEEAYSFYYFHVNNLVLFVEHGGKVAAYTFVFCKGAEMEQIDKLLCYFVAALILAQLFDCYFNIQECVVNQSKRLNHNADGYGALKTTSPIMP